MDRTAFGALVKRKRGDKRLTQEGLAEEVFGDPARKADISRFENGKIKPQEATIQRLCTVLEISAAEMEPIRQARPSAKQLDEIPTLSREDLENLAARFEIDAVYDRPDADLRDLLTKKAEEYRTYRAQIDGLDERVAAIANLKGAAQDAAEQLDLAEVEDLLSRVDEVETEIAAETKVARARNALLRNDPDLAFRLLSAAADSFASIDPMGPARKRLAFEDLLYQHGLTYGGAGLPLAIEMNETALSVLDRNLHANLYGEAQNNLGAALDTLGERQNDPEILARAVKAYEAALEVRTRNALPVKWAMTQNNLGTALQTLGKRQDDRDILDRAVTAYEAALEVYTRDPLPVDWATTQNNLGAVLRTLGDRQNDPEILDRAVTAYEAALEVRTRNALPVDWARTQNNLGNALSTLGERQDDPQILDRAVEAYEAALEVRTRDAFPVDWATTQNNLGTALDTLGQRQNDPEILDRAVKAYEAALEVRTRDALPVQWAMTQENIAIAELARAKLLAGDTARHALMAALEHVTAALTVYSPEDMSYNHEKAVRLREEIQRELDALG